MPNVKHILAFSGGPDSVYLLHKLLKNGDKPVLAHLNHGLRGKDSDEDENFCKKIAKKYGLEIETKKIKLTGSGIEEKARKARYGFLEKTRKKYGAKKILTAHHLNDNLETVLLNFIRGTGLNGLTGIKQSKEAKRSLDPKYKLELPVGQNLFDKIERPLLSTTKEEILAYLKKHRIKYRIDKSNLDNKFSRNFIRNEIIPQLKKLNPNLEKTFTKNLDNFKQVQDYLDSKSPDSITVNEFKRLHPAIQANTILKLAGTTDRTGTAPKKNTPKGVTIGISQKSLEETRKLILSGKTGKKKTLGDSTVEIQYGKVIFNPKTPAFKTTFKILKKHPAKLDIKNTVFLNFDKIRSLKKITLRTPLPGDRIQPLGLKGSQKLQDIFTNKKIPQTLRSQIPIVTLGKEILSIGWLTVAEKYKVTPKTKRILKISFKE